MQDHIRTIPAGDTIAIDVNVGDFIYCKFASAECVILVNGNPTTMQKGDWRREPQRFSNIQVRNPTANKLKIILTIGLGEFDRKTVTGEITITPGIRTETGEFVDDTRREYQWPLIVQGGAESHNHGSQIVIGEGDGYQYDYWFVRPDGIAYGMPNFNAGSRQEVTLYDAWSGVKLGLLSAGFNFDIGHRGYAYDAIADKLYLNMNNNDVYEFSPNPLGGWGAKNIGDKFHNGGGLDTYGDLIGASNGRLLFHDSGRAFVFFDLAANAGSRFVLNDVVSNGVWAAAIDDVKNNRYLFATYDGGVGGLYEVDSALETAVLLEPSDIMAAAYLGGNLLISRALPANAPADAYFIGHLETKTYAATLAEIDGCELVKRGTVYTSADATFKPEINGRWTIEGEVIRAALDAKLGNFAGVPDDYLDYVYAFEYTDARGQRKIVDTGARSFAGSSVADNFTARAPFEVKLTVRKGLL